MRSVLVVAAFLCLTGCATNAYRQFYTEFPQAADSRAVRASAPPAVPRVDHVSGTFDDHFEDLSRAGYAAVGYSSFNSGGNESDAGAVAQGVAVGADLILIMNPRYTGTVTSNVPLTLPTTQTSYTQGTATAYGSGGTVTANGNSTTTTYGTRTTLIPISVDRSDYGALYLIKRKYVLGAWYDPLTDAERAALGTNKGVRLKLIVNDTPAFESDLLVGDIVTAINGRTVSSPETMNALMGELGGQRVDISMIRNGATLTKSVVLNPASQPVSAPK